MKRLRLIMIALVLVSLSVSSYAQKVYKEGNYFVVDATGMPAAAVKTAAEVLDGTIDGSNGTIVMRHTHLLGNAGNWNVNAKVSPKFAVSEQDINAAGTYQTNATMNWMQASGWRNDGATVRPDGVYGNLNASGVVATTATGCNTYGGSTGGEQGEWRLPTQRELMLIWVLHEKLKLLGFASFFANNYWSATESSAGGSWAVSFNNGNTSSTTTTKTSNDRVRCVRDL